MSFIDAAIPLSIGLLLSIFPQKFVKAEAPDSVAKQNKMRKIGYVLVGVGILYAVMAVIKV